MSTNFELIIFSSFLLIILAITAFSFLKKRKRSAKNIYKLIDELEKKYIY